jgi:single-strand DNA-binding protein
VGEIFLTVTGNVASKPRASVTKGGHPVTSFRLAATPRRYDKAHGTWHDGPTAWFSVTCWRALADHVASCVGIGDPVMVHGRLQVKEFTRGDGTPGTSLDLDAQTVGHDLTRGTTIYRRSQPRPTDAAPSGTEGIERPIVGDEPQSQPEARPGDPQAA